MLSYFIRLLPVPFHSHPTDHHLQSRRPRTAFPICCNGLSVCGIPAGKKIGCAASVYHAPLRRPLPGPGRRVLQGSGRELEGLPAGSAGDWGRGGEQLRHGQRTRYNQAFRVPKFEPNLSPNVCLLAYEDFDPIRPACQVTPPVKTLRAHLLPFESTQYHSFRSDT
jgi:hypothetical protein